MTGSRTARCRIAVLASGTGTNLQALIDATDTNAIDTDVADADVADADALDARIVGVFSDKANCFALQRARAAGIPAFALSPKAFADRAAFDAAFFAEVDAARPDLIVCAGYMRIISAAEIARRSGLMINLHPSLLPAFKGLQTHRQALDAGATEHGASVHVVTADLDDGPVIAQARVPVLADDDVDTLAARVREVEHPLLVETVRLLAAGALWLENGRIRLNGAPLTAPLQLRANRRLA